MRLTFSETQYQLIQKFKKANIVTAERDASVLMCFASGYDALDLIRNDRQIVSLEIQRKLQDFAEQRLMAMPVSRIMQRREFYSLPFHVSSETLDPRPESEILVDETLKYIRTYHHPSILDLGTGSGCLLIACLVNCTQAIGIGIDISSTALEIAYQNAVMNNVEKRSEFRQGNWLDNIPEKFDVIVSNPPYIPSSEIAFLANEVRLYDPLLALDGGQDGLDAYRKFIASSGKNLSCEGVIIVEIGYKQEIAVKKLFRQAGYQRISTRCDLAGYERVIIAHKKST